MRRWFALMMLVLLAACGGSAIQPTPQATTFAQLPSVTADNASAVPSAMPSKPVVTASVPATPVPATSSGAETDKPLLVMADAVW